jgi:hypothetical protein
VKALHLKNCHADRLQTSNDSNGVAESLHKRVRMACVSCRKRKMRCDGIDPCAPCQASASACIYAGAARLSRNLNHTYEAFSDQQARDSVNTNVEGSLSFNPPRSQSNGDSLNDMDLGFLQDPNRVQFPVVSDSQIPISVSGEAISDGLALATSRDNLFHSFTDMTDIWRTPAIVRPHLVLWIKLTLILELSFLV